MELPDKTPPQTGKYLSRRLYFSRCLLAYHLLILTVILLLTFPLNRPQAENRSYSSYYTSYTDTIVTVIIGWHPRRQVHGGCFGAPRRELYHLPQAKGEVR